MDSNQANDFIEAIRAQRTEALDSAANWFAKFMAEKKRAEDLQAQLDKLKTEVSEAAKTV